MNIGLRHTVNAVWPGRRLSPECAGAVLRGNYFRKALDGVEVVYDPERPNIRAKVVLRRITYLGDTISHFDGLDPDMQYPNDPALFEHGAELDAEINQPGTLDRARTVEAVARTVKCAAAVGAAALALHSLQVR